MNTEYRDDHLVKGVLIERDVVVVFCACDWRSSEYATEAEGRAEFDVHRDTYPEPIY